MAASLCRPLTRTAYRTALMSSTPVPWQRLRAHQDRSIVPDNRIVTISPG
jgi:hypothetical protein